MEIDLKSFGENNQLNTKSGVMSKLMTLGTTVRSTVHYLHDSNVGFSLEGYFIVKYLCIQ